MLLASAINKTEKPCYPMVIYVTITIKLKYYKPKNNVIGLCSSCVRQSSPHLPNSTSMNSRLPDDMINSLYTILSSRFRNDYCVYLIILNLSSLKENKQNLLTNLRSIERFSTFLKLRTSDEIVDKRVPKRSKILTWITEWCY